MPQRRHRLDKYPPPSELPRQADEVRQGDLYEISYGRAIVCMPSGGRGSEAAATGATVLKSDPAVESAGVETGFSPSPDVLRAPDIAVGNVPQQPGWVQGVPPLAVEYADTGQNESDLAVKIRQFLEAGTRLVWVVRLTGVRRVEVHAAGEPMRLAYPGEDLRAPGILQNPVPVEALYDWSVGREVALRNLLQRHGYADLDAVRSDSLREAILDVFAARGLEVPDRVRAAVAQCVSLATLKRWLQQAATVASADAIRTF